jgi:hypothetical protein
MLLLKEFFSELDAVLQLGFEKLNQMVCELLHIILRAFYLFGLFFRLC